MIVSTIRCICTHWEIEHDLFSGKCHCGCEGVLNDKYYGDGPQDSLYKGEAREDKPQPSGPPIVEITSEVVNDVIIYCVSHQKLMEHVYLQAKMIMLDSDAKLLEEALINYPDDWELHIVLAESIVRLYSTVPKSIESPEAQELRYKALQGYGKFISLLKRKLFYKKVITYVKEALSKRN